MIPPRIQAEISQWPGASLGRVTNGGKHGRLTIRFGGRERFVTLPLTPSDWRAEHNQVRDVRRVLAELGATRNERRKASARRERNRPDRDPLIHIERAPVRPNPFAGLSQLQFAEPPRKTCLRRLMDYARRRAAALKHSRPVKAT